MQAPSIAESVSLPQPDSGVANSTQPTTFLHTEWARRPYASGDRHPAHMTIVTPVFPCNKVKRAHGRKVTAEAGGFLRDAGKCLPPPEAWIACFTFFFSTLVTRIQVS